MTSNALISTPSPSLPEPSLSKLDSALLSILVKDGRASFADIARQLGISRAHARARVQALQATTVSAQSALDATTAGFDVGTRTLVDVLNSQRDLFDAQRNYALARYDYVLTILTLEQAAGTLDAEDVTRVNAWLE